MKKFFAVFLLLGFSFLFLSTDSDRLYKMSKSLEIFASAFKIANQEYFENTDPNELMRVSIDSMLAYIDPYTNYFSEYQMEKAKINFKGFWDGVGFDIKQRGSDVIVSKIYEETAAENSSIQVGDELISIDGSLLKNKKIEDIDQSLHGKAGTQVKLSLKNQKGKNYDITLTRSKISPKNVPYFAMVDSNTAYIVLSIFTENASDNISNAFQELKSKNKIKQLILDLRDNGGGLLMEAVHICNLFMEKNTEICNIKSRIKEWDKKFTTLNEPLDTKIPLVVLINGQSASASEIVSGALQDYDRAVILGTKSFGKGLVQNTYDIGYNSKVKVTTARYFIPSGRCIQALEYKSGQASKVSDLSQKTFKTKNGRLVKDGGGIFPDLPVKEEKDKWLIQKLTASDIFFDIVNQYKNDHDSLRSGISFQLNEAEKKQFLQSIKKEISQIKSSTEIAIEKEIKKDSKSESILRKEDFTAILREIEAEKLSLMEKLAPEIYTKFEEEIVSRYFFEKGKIANRLKSDAYVQQAIALFNNPNRFQSILKSNQ